MLTANAKNLLACIITDATSGGAGLFPARMVNNNVGYIHNGFGNFPKSVSANFITSANGTGVCVGSGSTPATDGDYKLESMLTSLQGSIVKTQGVDNGKAFINFDVTITNSGSSDITISELGYQQYVAITTNQGGSSSSAPYPVLLDRTTLQTPITIAAGDVAIIRYRISCSIGE